MKKSLTAVLYFCVSVYSGTLFADSDLVSPQLESVIAAHVAASTKETESIDDLMKTIHPESPAYMQIKMQMEQMMPAFDMNVELVDFKFVAMDGDYAIARVKMKMEKVSGPMFQDHVSDQFFVFRQAQGQWKLWEAAMLNVESL